MPAYPHRRILGLNFYAGDLAGLVALTRDGGLVVVPSAPVLVDLAADDAHREAVEGGDVALLDSGYLVLLWLLLRREKLPRISGLKYLRALVEDAGFRQPGATLWVMPSAREAQVNLEWLNSRGFNLTQADCYLAPLYPEGPLRDEALMRVILGRRPRCIVICLGGGVQERLGWYLKRELWSGQPSAISSQLSPPGSDSPQSSVLRPLPSDSVLPSPRRCPDSAAVAQTGHTSSFTLHPSTSYRPAILCTGAAIAFMSGCQADIPPWADRFFLGWLLRTLRAPGRFLPRYLRSLRLASLLWRHGENSVVAGRPRQGATSL